MPSLILKAAGPFLQLRAAGLFCCRWLSFSICRCKMQERLPAGFQADRELTALVGKLE